MGKRFFIALDFDTSFNFTGWAIARCANGPVFFIFCCDFFVLMYTLPWS